MQNRGSNGLLTFTRSTSKTICLDNVVQNHYKISPKLPAVSLACEFSVELKRQALFLGPK